MAMEASKVSPRDSQVLSAAPQGPIVLPQVSSEFDARMKLVQDEVIDLSARKPDLSRKQRARLSKLIDKAKIMKLMQEQERSNDMGVADSGDVEVAARLSAIAPIIRNKVKGHSSPGSLRARRNQSGM